MKIDTSIQIIGLIVVIWLGLFFNPLESDTIDKITFFGIIITIVIFIFIVEIYKKVENNERRLKMINEKFDIYSRLNLLEQALNKGKKGQIDPRILLLILILILIYFYIKNYG